MKCPVCQKEIEDDSLFCEYCGAKLKKESSNKRIKIIVSIFVLLLILGLGFGGYLFYSSYVEKQELLLNQERERANKAELRAQEEHRKAEEARQAELRAQEKHRKAEEARQAELRAQEEHRKAEEVRKREDSNSRAIDLGLSVKWASCNVGATRPEQYGDYFAWGEVEPKTTYYWSTYKYCNGSDDSMTKYCNNSKDGYNGFTDNKRKLDLSDDVARMKWGGAWRMPTRAEQDELRNNCTWTWTTQNGVKGYKVVGPNGNSIFLPAAGCVYGGTLDDAGSCGFYWSSSLYTDVPSRAYGVSFYSDSVGWDGSGGRYYGLAVLPVCK